MTINEKLDPCIECGKVDKIKVGTTSVGCTRCSRYSVTTQFESIAYTWNMHNESLSHIARSICDDYDISLLNLQDPSRTANLVSARSAVAKAARKAGHTLMEIGDFLNRDHSTVAHYLNHRPEVA